MKLHIATIALDAMPFITWHIPVFNQLHALGVQWEWHIAEGVADNQHCTSWCQELTPRLSKDGTSEFLQSLRIHSNVHIYQKCLWDGKIDMFNTICSTIHEDCILMQIDSDELWKSRTIAQIMEIFRKRPSIGTMAFYCNYFVGWDRVVEPDIGSDNYGNRRYEWIRAWRFQRGDTFKTHEPPVLETKQQLAMMTRDEAYALNMDFDHYAYVTEEQVRFKEEYYGYRQAVEHWSRLQRVSSPVVTLKNYLPWVKDNAKAKLLKSYGVEQA